MTRKRNRSRKSRKSGGSSKVERVLSPEFREQEIARCLESGRHRDAIAHLKELLKQERRPEWVASLGDAYRARALDLAYKGMLKEAVVIWRNRAEFCSLPLSDPLFFRLLLGAGQIGQAVALLRETRADL